MRIARSARGGMSISQNSLETARVHAQRLDRHDGIVQQSLPGRIQVLEIVTLELFLTLEHVSARVLQRHDGRTARTRLSLPLETSQFRSGMWARLVIIEL